MPMNILSGVQKVLLKKVAIVPTLLLALALGAIWVAPIFSEGGDSSKHGGKTMLG